MADTVTQPTGRPTNKTLAFLVGTVITNAVMRLLEANDLMQWLATDAETLRELVYMGVSVLIGLAAAYRVRDRPNAPAAPAPEHSSDVRAHWLATLGAAGLALLLMGGLAGCAVDPKTGEARTPGERAGVTVDYLSLVASTIAVIVGDDAPAAVTLAADTAANGIARFCALPDPDTTTVRRDLDPDVRARLVVRYGGADADVCTEE